MGFLVTAYLTLIMVSIYYLVGYVPDEFLNTIDRGIIDTLWRKARSKPAKTWEPTIRSAVLMFSDQQLVTGLALLISGYAQLRCGISSYHWQMIIYLAWFSSMTHLTTLTMLRQYFRDNPAPRLWRAVLMLVMVTMLGFALLPSGDHMWFTYEGVPYNTAQLPALCFFKRLVARSPEERFEPGSYTTSSMLVSVLVLFASYLTRLVKLSKNATAFTKIWIGTKPGRMLKSASRTSLQRAERSNTIMFVYRGLQYFVLETAYVLLRACLDIYESTLWEVRSFQYPMSSFFSRAAYDPTNRADTMAKFCARLGYRTLIRHPVLYG